MPRGGIPWKRTGVTAGALAASLAACAALGVACAPTASAQEGEPPVVKVAHPLGVAPDATTKVLLRGLKLDKAQEVRCLDGRSTAKIVGQGNANVPNMQDAKRVGDRQVEIELTLPADVPVGELNLVVVTEQGESAPYAILVGGEYPIVAEQEPNDGFRQAQAIQTPQIVEGVIHTERNVDCFVFAGEAGQTIVAEVLSDRRGANLDALLSLYNERAELLATHDDLPHSRDARLEFKLPSAGKYYLVLQDAHDLGGPAHAYRLIVR
jgi:hypothetical protein